MHPTEANHQWTNRPDDQRFWTVRELYDASLAYREAAVTATVSLADLRVEADEGNIKLVGKVGSQAELTHWAFGQLCDRAMASPAGYLRRQPTTLAVQNLNWRLKAASTKAPKATGKLLLNRNGGYFCRAITSEIYTRIWNHEFAERLLRLETDGWKVPPASRDVQSRSRLREGTAASAIRQRTASNSRTSHSIADDR